VLGQQPLGEGVQRADRGAVELVERSPVASGDDGVGARRRARLQLGPQAVT
jgi:hypothetical protein